MVSLVEKLRNLQEKRRATQSCGGDVSVQKNQRDITKTVLNNHIYINTGFFDAVHLRV